MRTLYDSVSPENIPRDAQMVAGYIDGHEGVWTAAQWGYFPSAVKVRIATRASTNDGHVLDVESGDATPAQAPGWVQMRRKAGADPSVYCSLAAWPDVRAAFAGTPEPHYWIAAYPGNGAQLYPGSVAHQYADPGPYDLSVVADYWPGVDQGDDLTPDEHKWLQFLYVKLGGATFDGTGQPGAVVDDSLRAIEAQNVDTQKKIDALPAAQASSVDTAAVASAVRAAFTTNPLK